jgi:hypothetical protein
MPSMTLSVSEDFKEQLKSFHWVNWSDIARELIIKKEMFERYIKTRELSDNDWEICQAFDWHPVDELPIKPEFAKKLKKRKNEQFIKLNSISEIFE